MKFRKIAVRNFRNLAPLSLEPSPQVNVLFGENAQGKTNFLETIYTITHGKSFRTAHHQNLVSHETPPEELAWIQATVDKGALTHDLRFLVSHEQKKILLNEKKVSSSTVLREFSTVLFSPESLSVIKNSDQERRDLIDELIVSVFHQKSKVLDEFKRALKQRNKLLKDLKEGVLDGSAKNQMLLDTLTHQFLKLATEVVLLRLSALSQLMSPFREALQFILDENAVDIEVDYVISGQSIGEANASLVYDAMYKRWGQLRTQEVKAGHSLVGAHKHDIRILFQQKDSRFFCSQGQQRLIILAFKMAQIRLHFDVHSVYPILLLDDVLSEIDEKKRRKLIEYLKTINAQIFITTTEKTVLDSLSSRQMSVFRVEGGQVKSLSGSQEEMSV